MSRLQVTARYLRRGLFYALPVILLALIFRRVDLAALKEALVDTTPGLIALALALKSVPMLFGALRWRSVCLHTGAGRLPFAPVLRWYWAGFSIGFFTPGGLGWDAYRILALGKRTSAYTTAFLGVLLEKIVGLVTVVLLVLVMFPLVTRNMTVDTRAYTELHTLGLLGLLGITGISWVLLRGGKKTGWARARALGERMARRAARSLKNETLANSLMEDIRRANTLGTFFVTPRPLLVAACFSIAILASSALCAQVFFMGLGHEIPYRVNLFATPVFFLIFLMPLSFGGLGIREGAHILVFGLFGVPLETALLVSFFSLLGLLLNHGVGAVLLWGEPVVRPQAFSPGKEGA